MGVPAVWVTTLPRSIVHSEGVSTVDRIKAEHLIVDISNTTSVNAMSRWALGILCAFVLIAADQAHAQSEQVLHNFNRSGGGSAPTSRLTSDGKDGFYGTTDGGGLGFGTIFRLSPNGHGGWRQTVLHEFTGAADGAYPSYSGVMLDNAGNLYGTASSGGNGHGDSGFGVVFRLSFAKGVWTETVLYAFAGGADGAHPVSGVVMDASGNFYGSTIASDVPNRGTIFKLSPNAGGWSKQLIHYFGANNAGLTIDAAGNIFTAGYSKVYELSPNRRGAWNLKVIHTFAGYPNDGSDPDGTLVFDREGRLYGTTQFGGASGYGTVYQLTPDENEAWQEKILYSFEGGPTDGGVPFAGITFDAVENIFGTTLFAGSSGVGTVFELMASMDKSGYKEKVLWNFNGTDGALSYAPLLIDTAGNLYGTTYSGGAHESGAVFEVTP
jgi:uncharacterized repeat protein (TIGR03803 family)